MKSGVTDRDLGAKRLLRELAKAGEITVGIHEAEGAASKDGDEGGDMQLIDVAIVHEFGSEEAGIPRRSFIRDWSDDNEGQHKEQQRKAAKAVIDGKLDTETACKRLGVLWQGEVQQRIADGIPPPNKPATIARKGSSKPLVDTGQLRTSIRHAVKMTKGQVR